MWDDGESPISIGRRGFASSREPSMSRRVARKCPDCGCSYRVPAEKRATASCPKCVDERRGGESNIEFAEAEEPKKTFSVSVTRSATAASSVADPFLEAASRGPAQSEPVRSKQTHREESPTAKRLNKPAGDSQRDDVILNRLDELTKSMRFFKRLVWCMIIATALNALVMGIGLFYSMKMLDSIGSVFSAAGEIDPDQPGDPRQLRNGEGDAANLPPGLRQNLQAIQEYSDTVNELLQETN